MKGGFAFTLSEFRHSLTGGRTVVPPHHSGHVTRVETGDNSPHFSTH